ncbi:RraA family protein [Mucilaginibacter sp.]|uniref:RraA family protein n=1 Tax=Mucilaginibacter sp. TaxID=1882438 RepID=UPI0025E0DBB4|nr:RraA family protein [Mucilaginibacter sp.]
MKEDNNTKDLPKLWDTDDELFHLVRKELYTAVVGDIMDKLGLFNQFLPPQIVPLQENTFIVGRAMTVLEADVNSVSSNFNPILNKPFGLMLEALDNLKENEIYVCTGSSPDYALWGELMSVRAQKLGAAGAVVDGYSRDTIGIRNIGFPVFSHGRYAQDQAPRGKVIDYRVPIKIRAVSINPGDIVLGDIDGVCIIPKEVEEKVFSLAIEKARGEKMVMKKIEEGMSAKDAFEKYGIM